jgi:hypothetical protein
MHVLQRVTFLDAKGLSLLGDLVPNAKTVGLMIKPSRRVGANERGALKSSVFLERGAH